ncbi:MAG: Ig-like domain-containing protein [Verrucomicrobia bacterium]|nr:Ig-like domain-containing protein [Verrucomicrobiota bacterium]
MNTKPTVSDISMGAQTGVLQTLPRLGADKHAPYDADSNPMTISVVTQGTNNGVVVISGNNVTYSNNVAGLDSFTYTVSDNHGGSATGTVLVNVTDVVNQQATISYTGGTVSLTFWGVPGTSYTIQRATDVNGPWTDLTPDVTASSTQPYGQIPLSDTPPANGSYFYRLKP